jgi:hypothetical protein
MMMRVDVFDPEMCCSTGLCGPAPDEALIRIEGVLAGLRDEGVEISRHQLSRDPQAFLGHEQVYQRILSQGTGALPMVAVEGELRFTGRYPTDEELRAALEITT